MSEIIMKDDGTLHTEYEGSPVEVLGLLEVGYRLIRDEILWKLKQEEK